MVAWRYIFYFLVVKTIFYSLAALACKILFLPLENKIHIFAPPCNISIYYIDNSVFVENRPLVKFIRNYNRDLSGVFSISSLVRISMTSFPALTSLFVQKSSCLCNKKKVTLWLEDMNLYFLAVKNNILLTRCTCS